MYKPLSVFLAMRYVLTKNRHGFSSFISASSTLGIMLGVMVLIIVLSTMNGFQKELANKLLSIVPHAELIAVNEPIDDWAKSVAFAKQQPHVIAAAPVIKMDGLLQKGKSLKALEIRGVDSTLERQVSDIDRYLIKGNWQDINKANGIIVGAGIAGKLSLSVGDSVYVLLPSQAKNASMSTHFPAPIKKQVTVVGIFKFGGTIDEALAYMSLESAAKFVGLQPKHGSYQVDGIRLSFDNVFQAPRLARQVAYKFDHYAYIYDWTRTQGHLFSDIQLVRMVMFIVLSLVIAVASFNIVSTLVMVVNEKKSDIAILLTMGTRSGSIMLTFIIQGMVNGIIGCFFGVSFGLLIAENLTTLSNWIQQLFQVHFLSADVYFIDHLPSDVVMSDVVYTVIIALFLTVISTLYPAWRATKIDPAKILGQS